MRAGTSVAALERDLLALLQRHETLLRAQGSDLELRSDLGKHVCVRITGFVEQSVLTMARLHCDVSGSATAKRFALSWLERSGNPKRNRLIEFATRFDHTWGEELRALFDGKDPNNVWDGFVQTRNDIAHGSNTGISKTSLDTYWGLAIEVVHWFGHRFAP